MELLESSSSRAGQSAACRRFCALFRLQVNPEDVVLGLAVGLVLLPIMLLTAYT